MKKRLRLMGQILLVVFALYGMFAFVSQIISPHEAALADSSYAGKTSETLAQKAVPTPRAPEDLKGGLFVNLTTDDLDSAAMAIGFATKVRKNTGKPVTIFMNTHGVRLVDINIPQNTHKSGKTIHQMLQMFMDEGGVALVCPVCMKNVGGLSEDEILPGVIIGTPEYTFSAMLAEDVTVISY
jgi:predicted peroxiredoxin